MKVVFGIILLIFLGIASESVGQFVGGSEDGYSSDGTIPGFMMEQELYCGGGDADGTMSEGTSLLTFNEQGLYCTGGNADGYSNSGTNPSTFNDQQVYCKGGFYDGSSSSSFNGYYFDPLIVFNGTEGDGWSSGQFNGYFFPLFYTLGGSFDGTSSHSTGITSVNEQGFYCVSANGDGYTGSLYSGALMPYLYCYGGSGDGFRATISDLESMGLGIWTGFTNTDWGNAGNWKLNLVPILTTNVLIPAEAPNYPILDESLAINSFSWAFSCKRLDIYPGGQLTSFSPITINGIVNISGTMTFHRQGASTIQINSGGELNVKPGGTFSLE